MAPSGGIQSLDLEVQHNKSRGVHVHLLESSLGMLGLAGGGINLKARNFVWIQPNFPALGVGNARPFLDLIQLLVSHALRTTRRNDDGVGTGFAILAREVI